MDPRFDNIRGDPRYEDLLRRMHLHSLTMPLAPSTRLGPYEIVALIGAGGMSEVPRSLKVGLEEKAARGTLRRMLRIV